MENNRKVTQCLGCMELYEAYDNICPHCGYINGTLPKEMFHLEPGTVLQRKYLLGKVLGYGGFGITYIAWDQILKRKVAIKEYLPRKCGTRVHGTENISVYPGESRQQYLDGLRSFMDEAKLLMEFHDLGGIVKIYDRFEANNTAYIVMEYLDGETLDRRIARNGTMDWTEISSLMTPVMNALGKIHERGLIHRDISPDNIFLTNSGEVKLLDFGSARYDSLAKNNDLSIIVKPGYTPPEQYQIHGRQGPYTDIYALAAVIYEMLTGQVPEDSLERLSDDRLPTPGKLKVKIDKNQENALMNALNLSPSSRPQDMETFRRQLFDGDQVSRWADNSNRPFSGRKKWIAAAAAVMMITAAGLAYYHFKPVQKGHGFANSHDKEIIRVKSYQSLKYEEAEKLARKDGVHLVIRDTRNTYNNQELEDSSIGTILEQNPKAGNVLRTGDPVAVILSAGTRTDTMKDYVGCSKDEAIALAEQSKLIYETEIYTDSSSVIRGYVAAQNVEKGQTIPEGSAIQLFISSGIKGDIKRPENAAVPPLKGKTFDEALKIAEEYGFYLGIENTGFSDDTKKGCICRYTILKKKNGYSGKKKAVKDNTVIEPEDEIYVTISKGRKHRKQDGGKSDEN